MELGFQKKENQRKRSNQSFLDRRKEKKHGETVTQIRFIEIFYVYRHIFPNCDSHGKIKGAIEQAVDVESQKCV